MPLYSVHYLDDRDRVVERFDFECDNDLEAFKIAHTFCGEYQVELWEGRRKLYVLSKGAKLPKPLQDNA